MKLEFRSQKLLRADAWLTVFNAAAGFWFLDSKF